MVEGVSSVNNEVLCGKGLQVDLFTTRCPHDELGGLKNAIELRFFACGRFLIGAQQQYPMFHFLSCYFLF